MNGMPSAAILAISRIVNVTITDDTLSVNMEDGRTISVPIGWYPRLAFSGAGYGVHWPDLDEDIGVEGLLLGKKSMESQSSLERWLQRRKSQDGSSTLSI